MAVVGPGSVQQDHIAPEPTLNGASEYEYVTILNPLGDDFQIMVAQDVPVDMPFQVKNKTGTVQDESDVRRVLGFDLKNPEHPSKQRVIMNSTIIPSGRTINLKGNEAQVAVRQLVNEILQREGKRLLMADPNLRKEVEDRIIVSRGSVQDLMDSRLKAPQTIVNEAINKSNEVQDEQSFAGLDESSEPDTEPVRDTPEPTDSQTKPSPGRPKKVS